MKEPKERMIKRVTGLPDDLIHTDDAKLVRVPRGYCWIEGDNASVSLDSNVFGAVRAHCIVVVVVCLVLTEFFLSGATTTAHRCLLGWWKAERCIG